MHDVSSAFVTALQLLIQADPVLLEIIRLSLQVSASALLLASIIGLPLGAWLGLVRFPGRGFIIALLNALMGLPPVVVGLLIYLLLSRSGPLGYFGWLFSPAAMIVAQTVLITPIIAALTRQVIEDLEQELGEQLRSLGAHAGQVLLTLLWEGRYSLLITILAGFGRSIAEVGAVIIVGGNIAHVTRTMTTAIALETSKGDLPLALGLGFILLGLALLVNIIAHWVKSRAR